MHIAEEIDRHGPEGEIVDLVKAHVIGADISTIQPSNVQQPSGEPGSSVESGNTEIEWPYDPRLLCSLFEMSSAVRPNVDAYITNIDAFGHEFEPTIDLGEDDTREVIGNAILLDRVNEAERNGFAPEPTYPSEEEIDAKIEDLKIQMKIERARLKAFYNSCCVGTDFVRLRRKTRQDIEVLGNGFWEVIRQIEGRIVLFNYVPAFTIKICKLTDPVEVPVRVQASDLTFEQVTVQKRFRRYVQRIAMDGRAIWFKEFGDPRTMSATTGRYYESIAVLRQEEPGVRPATELLHFNVDSPRTPYGIPRWVGTLLAVVGTRQSEEVNFLYFENKSVPPLAVLVSGGRLAPQATEKIREHVQERIKGKKNFHSILVIEAEPSAKHQEGAGRFKIELKPLTQAIQSDALFQKYDERNHDKVGQAFRLPRMLRGDIRDFNKSTAQAALMFAEMQVFQPEREDFDAEQNQKILPDLGIRYWRFESRSPIARDPQVLAGMVRDLVRTGVLTPNEARALCGDIFNREFHKIDAEWAEQPLQLTLAEINVEAKGIVEAGEKQEATEAAKRLLPIAKLFLDLNAALDQHSADEAFEIAKREIADDESPIKSISKSKSDPSQVVIDVKNDEGEIETIRVPTEKMLEWIIPHES